MSSRFLMFALGVIVGILLTLVIKTIAIFLLIGFAVIGIIASYRVVTTKTEAKRGG